MVRIILFATKLFHIGTKSSKLCLRGLFKFIKSLFHLVHCERGILLGSLLLRLTCKIMLNAWCGASQRFFDDQVSKKQHKVIG